jgi:hypothetical protein
MADWLTPTSVKDLRSFLGLAGYYRKFIKHFGTLARPMNDVLKKSSVFVWADEKEMAFQTLKQALVEAPVLALPNFTKSFHIEADSCDYGVGAMLMQYHHPISYVSKALGSKLRGLSTYKKEYVAILLAVEQWRSYLQFGEFCISTYQKSMSHLNEQRLHTPWQHKVFTKLLGLSYKIVYKQGSKNRAADASLGSLLQKLLVMLSLFVSPSGWIRLFRAMKLIIIPNILLLNR